MLQPTLDNVVVKKIEPEGKSKGGILIPESAKKETFTGTVVAVGPGRIAAQVGFLPTLTVTAQPVGELGARHLLGVELRPGVKPGDVAVFNQFAGNKVKVQDEDYLILQAEEVLAILVPDLDEHREAAARDAHQDGINQ